MLSLSLPKKDLLFFLFLPRYHCLTSQDESMLTVLIRPGSTLGGKRRDQNGSGLWIEFISALCNSLNKNSIADITVPMAGTQTPFISLFCQL